MTDLLPRDRWPLAGDPAGRAPRRGLVHLPVPPLTPLRWATTRFLLISAFFWTMVLVIWLDRAGYRDTVDGSVSLLDSIYFSTLSLSTAGYGDIVPVTTQARLANTFVVAPLRIGLLIVIGFAVLELANPNTRERWRAARWRKKLTEHVLVVGYDTKGRSAARTLLRKGISAEHIVVIDNRPEAVDDANKEGLAAVLGDAARREVLLQAAVEKARRVVIATARDDTAVLVTLTVRQLNPDATVVVAVNSHENTGLLRQSSADVVVTSSDSVGRLLGLSTVSPQLGTVLEDLLAYGEGLEVTERPVLPREEGQGPRKLDDVVLAVVRDGQVHRYFEPAVSQLLRGDRVIVVRPAEELPWAARPGEE